MDEHEFSLTGDAIDNLIAVCPVLPTLDQLASGDAKSTDETEFREELRDNISSLQSEHYRRNEGLALEQNQPWYCGPLNVIARQVWWICQVLVTSDGLVTVSADGFAMLKCKFKPRHGDQENVFEVVKNHWQGQEAPVWTGWTPGNIFTLDDFIIAMDATRCIANSRAGKWDDTIKVFAPEPYGDLLPRHAV